MFRGLASCFSNFHLFLALEKACGIMPSGESPNVKLAQQFVRRGSYDGIGMIATHSKNRPHQATRDRKGNFGAKNLGPDIPHLFQMVRAPLGVHVLFCVLEGKIP